MSWALVGLRARLLAVLFAPEQLREVERNLVVRLRDLLEALTFLRNEVRGAVSGPALASVTVLCETPGSTNRNGLSDKWVPSVLGGEVFVTPGQSAELSIMPQRTTRNFRWFVSGHPDIVCTAFLVGNESAHAAYGGTKFGEFEGECRVGYLIRVSLEFKKAVHS